MLKIFFKLKNKRNIYENSTGFPTVRKCTTTAIWGTERIVSFLTEELVRQGHEVTLFASEDSRTSARLIPYCFKALRLDKNCLDQLAPHVLQLEQVQQRISEFDIVHYHIDHIHFPFAKRAKIPHVTTSHGRMNMEEYKILFRESMIYLSCPFHMHKGNLCRWPVG